MVCPRLTIESIPYNSRLATLAKLLPSEQWDMLRHSVNRRARYRCQICGHERRMYCHEIWQFNEKSGYQFLRGLKALCELCHGVKHLLFVRNDDVKVKMIKHFMTINRVTLQQAEKYLSSAYHRQRRLNQREWIVNYGQYNWNIPATATVEQRRSYARFNHPSRHRTNNQFNQALSSYYT